MKVLKVHKKPLETKKKINPREIQKSYMETIEDDLEDQGAVFFDQTKLDIDSDFLSLPKGITEVPSKLLGEYLNAFTQQKMYLRTLLGRVDLMLEEKKRIYLEKSTPIYRKYSLDKMSETAKDRLVNSNEEVRPFYYDYADYKKKCGVLETSIANIEDAIFMISREVTRRNGDFGEENRAHNVGRR